MPDKSFEDFIRQHRPDFEEHGPSPGVWAQLEKELMPPKKETIIRRLGRNWVKAAAILVLVSSISPP